MLLASSGRVSIPEGLVAKPGNIHEDSLKKHLNVETSYYFGPFEWKSTIFSSFGRILDGLVPDASPVQTVFHEQDGIFDMPAAQSLNNWDDVFFHFFQFKGSSLGPILSYFSDAPFFRNGSD